MGSRDQHTTHVATFTRLYFPTEWFWGDGLLFRFADLFRFFSKCFESARDHFEEPAFWEQFRFRERRFREF